MIIPFYLKYLDTGMNENRMKIDYQTKYENKPSSKKLYETIK